MDREANSTGGRCDWISEEIQTELRANELLDSASCLFLSVLPSGEAVPALICLFVLLTLLSILVNGTSLLGLGRSEDLSWEPRFALLKNLIVSDLVQTVTFGPTVIHSLIHRRTLAFSTWCYVQFFLGTTCIFSSLVTITCMALERYVYVCHAIHYFVILTDARLRLALSLIWIYSVSITVTQMALLHTGSGQNNVSVTNGLLCEPDTMEQLMGFPRAAAVFRKLVGFLTLLLCLLVHAFSYLRMYQDARNAVIPFNAVNTTARKTVLFYCSMLFLQLLPLLLKSTSDALWEVEGTVAMTALSPQSQGARKGRSTPSVTAAVLHISLLIVLIVPPCINPLVYGLRNSEVRQALPSLFRGRTERRGPGVREMAGMRAGDVVLDNRAQGR